MISNAFACVVVLATSRHKSGGTTLAKNNSPVEPCDFAIAADHFVRADKKHTAEFQRRF
jgi:hypothetical protein